MAIYLSKGEHIVEMMPHSLYLAKAERVTLLTVLALCLYGIVALALLLMKRNTTLPAKP